MRIPTTKQGFPGKEHAMPGPEPARDQLPSTGGRCRNIPRRRGQPAATAGIGAATALLFARDGGGRVHDLRIPPPTMETDGRRHRRFIQQCSR
ncbi:hypothetical protein ARSEF4850_006053 [Beauveria asiatica]